MKIRHVTALALAAALLLLSSCTAAAKTDNGLSPEAEKTQAGDLSRQNAIVSFSDDSDAIELAAASVVRLDVYDANDKRLGTGSGFAIGDPAVLVTAAHVIKNMDHMTAWKDDGTSFQVGRALDADTDADVAVCPLPKDAGLTALPAADESPKRGDDVLVISSQFGLTNLVSKGSLSGYWKNGETDWLLFSAPVSGGSSGGPLFNKDGKVCGIITGTYEKGQNLNLAAPIGVALGLIK